MRFEKVFLYGKIKGNFGEKGNQKKKSKEISLFNSEGFLMHYHCMCVLVIICPNLSQIVRETRRKQ